VGETQYDHSRRCACQRRSRTASQRHDPCSQSTKSAEGGEKIGFDGGKLVKGRKRNLMTDTIGLVVLAKVTAANVQDVHAGKQILIELKKRTEV
jgi:hypothetical protein